MNVENSCRKQAWLNNKLGLSIHTSQYSKVWFNQDMLVKVRVLEKGTFISNEYNGMGKRKCIKHHNSINSVELFFSFEGPMTSFTRKSNNFSVEV